MNNAYMWYYTPFNMIKMGKNKAILGLIPPIIVPKTGPFCTPKCTQIRHISFCSAPPNASPSAPPILKMARF